MVYEPGRGAGSGSGSKSAPGSSGNTRTASNENAADAQIIVKRGSDAPPGGMGPIGKKSEYRTLDYLLKKGYDHSKGWVSDLQTKLVRAGLLDPDGFTNGLYDESTLSAYQILLLRAANYGKTPDETFDLIFSANPKMRGGGGGGGGPTRAPFRAELPNPDDVKAVIDKLAPTEIGRTLSADQIAMVIREYNSILTGAQRSAYDTALSGGTVTDAPDISTFVTNKARELAPQEADTFQKFSLVGDVMSLLGLGGARG